MSARACSGERENPPGTPGGLPFLTGAARSGQGCAGSDPCFVVFLAAWGLGFVPDPVSQMLNLSSELHRLLQGCFCTAKQTANAIRLPRAKGLHQFAKRCNRQASRQPSRNVSASLFNGSDPAQPPEPGG